LSFIFISISFIFTSISVSFSLELWTGLRGGHGGDGCIEKDVENKGIVEVASEESERTPGV
jgi:hypothetical protein